jgi:23S rRNA pseudouridine1911/1915/1917 synthase
MKFTFEGTGEPRLDVWLAGVSGLTRSAIQRLLDEGQVRWNGELAKARQKLRVGDQVELHVPAPKASALTPRDIPLTILYQDEHLAVIEKPAGLVVHPGAGHEDGTLVHALLHHLKDLSAGKGIGGELRPGIVHRIDRQTSGVLLVTKTDEAHLALSKQFKDHSITRRYRGLCWGKLPELGEWNAPIARDPKERKRMAIVEGGRRAVTRFRAVERYGSAATLFEAELLTGRTHQVRVHFAAHGFPLAGDATYARAYRAARNEREAGLKLLRRACPEAVPALEALDASKRQFLHAAYLEFTHPATGERLSFASEVPPDLAAIVVKLATC